LLDIGNSPETGWVARRRARSTTPVEDSRRATRPVIYSSASSSPIRAIMHEIGRDVQVPRAEIGTWSCLTFDWRIEKVCPSKPGSESFGLGWKWLSGWATLDVA
jgi:hypothetical protein